jgi:hypothetical protein
MTTTSYPGFGNNGLTIGEWPEVASIGDGIIEDYTGNACDLSRLNSTDICRVSPGKIRVAGYVLDITANEDLYCPPVITGNPAITYYICAMYDPALNVADGSGNRPALGPCRLIISAGPPTTAGGQQYVLLYTLYRTANQLVAETTKTDYRRWIGPRVELDLESGFPSVADSPVGFGPFPRGTTGWNRKSNISVRMTFGSGGTLQWVRTAPVETLLDPATGFTAQTGESGLRYIVTDQRWVSLAGTIRRSNGTNILSATSTSDVTIATVPVAPATIRRFPIYTDGQDLGWVKVTASGVVSVYASGINIAWVDLSNVQYQGV